MKSITTSILFLLLIINPVFSQETFVNKEWENTIGTVGTVKRTVSAMDNSGNLIVVSNTINSSNNTDVLIIKYSQEGDILWQNTYNGQGNGDDYGVQIKINNSNDIFVASAIQGNTSLDFGILKYSSSGLLVWSNTWNGDYDGLDTPADIDIDDFGNVYLVGGTEAANSYSDYGIVKFNSNGSFAWQASYDYANLHDAATSIRLVDNNNVIVTGASASDLTNWDFSTLKINTSNGLIGSVERTVVPGVGLDNAAAVTTDPSGNIYVTGYVEIANNRNIQTVKFNSNFELEWVKNFDGGFEDVAKAIGVDDFGNVYITGSKENSNGSKAYVTIKYNPSGIVIWNEEFGQSNNGANTLRAESLAITANGDVVVTGTKSNNGNKKFVTVKYTSGGKIKTTKEFDAGGQNNEAQSIIADGDDIYVSGVSEINNTLQSSTVKYSFKEKIVNFVYNDNGEPIYEANDILVRLDPSVLIMTTIDNKGIEAGKLEDFILPEAVAQIRSVIKLTCGASACDVNVYKVFRQLTSQDETTISRLGDEIPIPKFWATLLFEFPDGVDVKVCAASLNTLFPMIKYCDANFVAKLHNDANDSFYANEQESLHSSNVNQPVAHINAEEAWNLETGKRFVKVGVFDSGILWNHEDFMGGTIPTTKIAGGWELTTNSPLLSNTYADNNGHGTSCAGIIGAIRNNNLGIAGIAGGNTWEGVTLENSGVSLYGMTIFENNQFYYATFNYIADAIVMTSIDNPSNDYSYGLNIMSNSWGANSADIYFTDTNNVLLTEAIHFTNRAKVTYVASAGNEGGYFNQYVVSIPAIIDDDWVLCVGGTGIDGDYKDIFNGGVGQAASYGPHIDVAAPMALGTIYTLNNDGGYREFNGTSASGPHVAGLASLLMSYLNEPTAHYNNLAPEDVEYILQMTADDCNVTTHPGVDTLTGFGRINAGNALEQVKDGKFNLSHFGTNTVVSDISVWASLPSDTVFLDERFENASNQWFQPGVKYVVNKYQVNATVYHGLPVTESIVAFWPRHSSSTLFPLYDSNNYLLPRERIVINSLDNSSADLTGYVYHVSDSIGNFLGWWPFDTTLSQMQFEYSILSENLLFDGIEEENINEISVYPNPSNGEQVVEINLSINSNLSIALYDMSGKLVKDIYTGVVEKEKTRFEVSLEQLTNGVYLYCVITDDKTYYYKIVKEK